MVPSSCIVICMPPSPAIAITVLSGAPYFAPIAVGNAKPIVPNPPLVILLFVWFIFAYLQATIWCCPTSVTIMASPFVNSFKAFITSPIDNISSTGFISFSIQVVFSFIKQSLNCCSHSGCVFGLTNAVSMGRVSLQSPQTGTVAFTFLSISEGSISK